LTAVPPADQQDTGCSCGSPLLTLLSDFGDRDYYVGAMKGVILRHAPAARILDLAHQIPPQDVLAAAFVLHHAAGEFPPQTVHVAVVDPGVGTQRRALVLRNRIGTFVAPDNGLLSLVYRWDPGEVRALVAPFVESARLSSTFHGRDLFAPAAARLACGYDLAQVGPVVRDPVLLEATHARVDADGIHGQVIHVDGFGNLVTSVAAGQLPAAPQRTRVILPGNRSIAGLSRTYADALPGRPMALVGSCQLLEIAVRDASAAALLGLRRGDPVRVHGH
jgi:hypothetical protein